AYIGKAPLLAVPCSLFPVPCSLSGRQQLRDPPRDLPQRGTRSGIRGAEDDRGSLVAALTDLRLERDLAEQREVGSIGELLAAAGAEEVVAGATARADEAAHVLDYAEDGRFDPFEHADRPPHVAGGHLLRGGDDDHSVDTYRLDQGELRVAGTGRHVDDHVVQRSPLDLLDELLEDP